MEFNTQSGKKRQMVVFPEVNPTTFLLFFDKGNSGHSWSLRDYSVPNRVREYSGRKLKWLSTEIRSKVRFSLDAPTESTGNLSFWHRYTIDANTRFLNGLSGPATPTLSSHTTTDLASSRPEPQFPILNFDRLRTLQKAGKRGDLERILFSPNSEDWVTWNLMNLLTLEHPLDWWQRIVSAARAVNRRLEMTVSVGDQPRLEFWRCVASPAAYKAVSRMRMRQSADPHIAARSHDPKPVEGDSEIDVVLSTNRHLVFVEAKLGSDISMRTTYDPCRNQIVRNIDCLLENASRREPFFWMFVRGTDNRHAYWQLAEEYSTYPEKLCAELPHRDPELLKWIARNIAVIRWQDLAKSLLNTFDTDTNEVRNVKQELAHRILR